MDLKALIAAILQNPEGALEAIRRMPKPQPRQIPAAITSETLAAIPENDLWDTLCDYVGEYLDRDDGVGHVAKVNALPAGLRFAWELSGFEFEVPNGGFDQYFHNPSGAYASRLLTQLHAAGAAKRAKLLEQGILLFEKVGRPCDYKERWFGPTPTEDEVDELLSEYVRIAKDDDVRMWFAAYARAHPECFFHTP